MSRSLFWPCALLCAGLIALPAVNPRARGIAMALAGKNQSCPWASVSSAIPTTNAQIEALRRIEAGSRLISRDASSGLELWQTPRAQYWIPAHGSKEVLLDLAEQERGIYSLDGKGVEPGQTVLDCGANVGVYTREALRRGAARVVAIEPVPQLVACLRRNFANEIASGRVIVVPKGVWNKNDVLPMHVDPDNSAANSFVASRAASRQIIDLPLTTVDQIAQELRLERVDWIKMDIEGAERNALAGARATLRAFAPRLAICVYHLPDDPTVIPAEVMTARPQYKAQCGPCLNADGRLIAQVFFFSD